MAKILVTGFSDFPPRNGLSIQLRYVCDALVRDHTVDLLVARRGEQAYVEKLGKSGRLLRVPIPEGDATHQLGAFHRALRRQLEGSDYDVVHFCDPGAGVVAIEVATRVGFATVYDVARSPLTTPLEQTGPELAERVRDHETCLGRADLVFLPHQRALEAQPNPHLAHLHVVPPGVDVDAFDWEVATHSALSVLYLGSLTAGRGLDLLLRAWHQVVQHSDGKLLLAGRAEPNALAALAKTAEGLKIDRSVQFLGEIAHEQVSALMARASLCVIPAALDFSPRAIEVYPTKLLEYLACRRAVVAPDAQSIRLVCHERHVLFFEPGKPRSLANAILRLSRDAGLADSLAAAGYGLVRSDHTASNTRRLLRRAYDSLLAQDKWRDRITAHPRPAGDELAPSTGSSSIEGLTLGDGEITNTSNTTTGHSINTEVTTVEAPRDELPTERMPTRDDHLMDQGLGSRSDHDLPAARSEPLVAEDMPFVAGEFEVPTPDPEAAEALRPGRQNSIEFVPEAEEKTGPKDRID